MIGEKLGKYRLTGALGSGSMGTVYRAEDPDHTPVAIKFVPSHILYDADRRERFLRSVLPVAGLVHPGVCPILEIGDDDDDFFLVMPLLEGKRLDVLLRSGALDWRGALEIAAGIADALAAGHAVGAVHRGLKPANVWLQEGGRVVLTDFSVARFTEIDAHPRSRGRARLATAETILPAGALAYMAPEQIRGQAVDTRTDVFSLGVILYEMLTGSHPFESRNSLSRMSAILEVQPRPLGVFRSDLPAGLEELVLGLLVKQPASRSADVTSLGAELRRLRDQPDAPPPPPAGRPVRLRVVALVAALLAALALLVCIYAAVRGSLGKPLPRKALGLPAPGGGPERGAARA